MAKKSLKKSLSDLRLTKKDVPPGTRKIIAQRQWLSHFRNLHWPGLTKWEESFLVDVMSRQCLLTEKQRTVVKNIHLRQKGLR